MKERPRDGEPLPHAARELPYEAVGDAISPTRSSHFAAECSASGCCQTARKTEVFDGAELVVDADGMPENAHAAAGLLLPDIIAEDAILLCRPGKPCDGSEECRLPCSIAAEQSDARSGLDSKRDVEEGGKIAEELPDVLDRHGGLAHAVRYSMTEIRLRAWRMSGRGSAASARDPRLDRPIPGVSASVGAAAAEALSALESRRLPVPTTFTAYCVPFNSYTVA